MENYFAIGVKKKSFLNWLTVEFAEDECKFCGDFQMVDSSHGSRSSFLLLFLSFYLGSVTSRLFGRGSPLQFGAQFQVSSPLTSSSELGLSRNYSPSYDSIFFPFFPTPHGRLKMTFISKFCFREKPNFFFILSVVTNLKLYCAFLDVLIFPSGQISPDVGLKRQSSLVQNFASFLFKLSF